MMVKMHGKVFHGYYVSEYGELYSVKTGLKKYTWLNKGRSGFYERAQFWIEGKKKNFYVHRIVAQMYLPDWDEELEVDHFDEDTLNNHYLNLGMKTTTDNQLAHQDYKDGVRVVRHLRGCVFQEGTVRGYFKMENGLCQIVN